MSSWTGIPELRATYRQFGALRFWAVLLSVLGWCVLGAWMMITLNYPQAYGSTCRHKCLIEEYWFSPALLRHGGALDYALFAFLWSMPALAAAIIIRARLRKRALAARTHILPMTRSDSE